jgi:translation initiation factor 3 subunit G
VQGRHFTAKCPYEGSLAGLDAGGIFVAFKMNTILMLILICQILVSAPMMRYSHPTTKRMRLQRRVGKYVPLSMRGAGCGPDETMGCASGSHHDLPTLRMTNISEDTQENDLRICLADLGGFGGCWEGLRICELRA